MTTSTAVVAPPLWPTATTKGGLSNLITPHALAQSAIFSTQVFRSQATRPRYSEKTQLASLGHMSVFQLAGEQLDQNDADVFLELLRRVLENGDGDSREARVCFNRVELLRSIGRSKGGNTLRLLSASLERLTDATFYFQIPELLTGRSRLILKSLTQEDAPELEADYEVLIDVELAKLFGREQWSFLRKAEREKLSGDPLAKGLHAYYSTHKLPHAMLISTVQRLMGREGMQASKFRRALQSSLSNLKRATGWFVCEIAETGPKKGKVVVVKSRPVAAKKESKAPKGTQLPALAEGTASTSWDQVRCGADLDLFALEELVALMDERTNREWTETLTSLNTEDEDILWRGARGVLERQWVAVQAGRGVLPHSDDDI